MYTFIYAKERIGIICTVYFCIHWDSSTLGFQGIDLTGLVIRLCTYICFAFSFGRVSACPLVKSPKLTVASQRLDYGHVISELRDSVGSCAAIDD